MDDEQTEPEPHEKPDSRARILIVLSWVLRLVGLLMMIAKIWVGVALLTASIALDFAAPRPRPRHEDRIVITALAFFGILFITGLAGVWMAGEHPWSAGVLMVGLVGIVVCELFHYARADVLYVKSQDDAQSETEEPGDEKPSDGMKREDDSFRLKNDD